MSKQIKVEYRDGTAETLGFPDKLYDLGWSNYQKIERKIKMNAEIDRNGDVQGLNIDQDRMGDFLVDIQETMAEAILAEQNIQLSDVNVATVKKIVRNYGGDMEELGLKLKKKKESSTA